MKAPALPWDITRILFAVVAIGGLIAASFWVLRLFLPAMVWAGALVTAPSPPGRVITPGAARCAAGRRRLRARSLPALREWLTDVPWACSRFSPGWQTLSSMRPEDLAS